MKKTLLLLFCFASVSAFSQIKTTVDEFTGAKTIKSEWVFFTSKMSINPTYFRFSNFENTTLFECKFTSEPIRYIKKGGLIYLKLKNGEVLKLESIDNFHSKKGAGAVGYGGSGNYGIHAIYFISKEQLEVIEKQGIEKIRIDLKGERKEYKGSKKVSNEISKMINLFLNEL